jgi:hypothetical protein
MAGFTMHQRRHALRLGFRSFAAVALVLFIAAQALCFSHCHLGATPDSNVPASLTDLANLARLHPAPGPGADAGTLAASTETDDAETLPPCHRAKARRTVPACHGPGAALTANGADPSHPANPGDPIAGTENDPAPAGSMTCSTLQTMLATADDGSSLVSPAPAVVQPDASLLAEFFLVALPPHLHSDAPLPGFSRQARPCDWAPTPEVSLGPAFRSLAPPPLA